MLMTIKYCVISPFGLFAMGSQYRISLRGDAGMSARLLASTFARFGVLVAMRPIPAIIACYP